MVEDKWLLLASIPVVIFLGVLIRRRIVELNDRIAQLKREEAAGPVNPYQAMYEMMPDADKDNGPKQPSPLLLKAMGKSSKANGHAPADSSEPDGRSNIARQEEDNDG